MEFFMRTTLDIADDVLFAAKEIAQREKKPLGVIISDLARRSFLNSSAAGVAGATSTEPASPQVSERLARYGIHPLPSRGGIVSNELIDRMREAEGI
jgi:acyl transferase domain-containing protein